MTSASLDRLTGTVLVIAAALWCWAVMTTVPGADEPGRLGPRGFPLGLGVLLAVLGLAVIAGSWSQPAAAKPVDPEGPTPLAIEVWAVVMTLVLIAGYAVAMEQTGFLVATAATVAAAVTLVLRIWRPVLVLGLALGLSVGIYLVFGKLLGVYLPHGRLIDLTF